MATYRKKPVVIEAFQYTGGSLLGKDVPKWFSAAVVDGVAVVEAERDRVLIVTKEGRVEAHAGDWIIRHATGQLHPCKRDIFAATYEPV